MITINYGGRLGNNMLQYSASKIFSNKHKIKLVTQPKNGNIDFTSYVKKTCDKDHKIFNKDQIIVTNENFLNLLSLESCETAHYIFSDYFQISKFVNTYNEEIKKIFIDSNTKKSGVFVHYRIGDIQNTKNMLPIEYYIDCLDRSGQSFGVICSDTPNHENVLKLSSKYNLSILTDDPLNIIDLGRKYDNIILSEGTFSWWIGTLSSANNIFYNERERFWHGDIFTNKDWIKLNYE